MVLLTPIALNLPKNKHLKSLCTLVKWHASGEKSGKIKVINTPDGNSLRIGCVQKKKRHIWLKLQGGFQEQMQCNWTGHGGQWPIVYKNRPGLWTVTRGQDLNYSSQPHLSQSQFNWSYQSLNSPISVINLPMFSSKWIEGPLGYLQHWPN